MSYIRNILKIIRSDPKLKILRIVRHKPRNIRKFIKQIYSFDYAPFDHLKEKTKYLERTPSEVIVVFIHNRDVQEVLLGDGPFHHVECKRIKRLKEAIRHSFNPRKNGKRTEDHVVHASDNEEQTDRLMRHLGFENGIETFRRKANSLMETPYHIPPFSSFRIKSIPLSKLDCNLFVSDQDSSSGDRLRKRRMPLEKSPHCACLKGECEEFERYLAQAAGVYLVDDHSVENLLTLAESFKYLDPEHCNEYILTRYCPSTDRYLILDGLHRASILASRGIQNVTVAVI